MIGSKKYQLSELGLKLHEEAVEYIENSKYKNIVNPCGEITLKSSGGYCVIGDLVPFFADTRQEILESVKLAARFLVRVNLMDAIYSDEVKRTNRIGISLTGIHEFAWKFFNYGFRDLINEEYSQDFWNFLNTMRITAELESARYSDEIGVNAPLTVTTIKPSGSVSKLFGLTEGAHLPAHRYYLRWVQIQKGSSLLEQYRNEGYLVKDLISYPNVSIVAFPTIPLITTLGMNDEQLVIASEATPEEQFQWLMLLEKYWLGEGSSYKGNQISYSLKLSKDEVTLEQYRQTLLKFQSQVRCCSVMPSPGKDELATTYEYLPEEEVSKEYFDEYVKLINKKTDQDFSVDELQCSSGACPL